jgi:hypothetical protein
MAAPELAKERTQGPYQSPTPGWAMTDDSSGVSMSADAMPAGFTTFVREFARRHGGAHFRAEWMSKEDLDYWSPASAPAPRVFRLPQGTATRAAAELVPVPPGTRGSVELHGLPGFERDAEGWASALWLGLLAR